MGEMAVADGAFTAWVAFFGVLSGAVVGGLIAAAGQRWMFHLEREERRKEIQRQTAVEIQDIFAELSDAAMQVFHDLERESKEGIYAAGSAQNFHHTLYRAKALQSRIADDGLREAIDRAITACDKVSLTPNKDYPKHEKAFEIAAQEMTDSIDKATEALGALLRCLNSK